MTEKGVYKALTYLISIVWIVNGLFCKVLNLTPRHEEIVARILGAEYSKEITIIIGILEVLMAIWILSGFKSKTNALIQIILVFVMNIIEFSYASDLLLWGKLNILFAMLFVSVVYYQGFILKNKIDVQVA